MEYSRVQSFYNEVVKKLIDKKITISTMESCTGGQIASFITNVDGSSAILKEAYITYSNDTKIRNGVSQKTIEEYGVYSPETARSMAETCKRNAKANIGIGVTGSLNTVDPANTDSVCGVVHYCVVMSAHGFEDMRIGDIRFLPGKTRMEMKIDIAEKIILLVKDLLLSLQEH